MIAVDKVDDILAANFMKSLDPVYVGAELFVASSGDMVAMLSRSPARNHYSQSGDVSGEPAALQRPVAKRFKGLPSKMAMCGACFAQKQAAGEAA